MEVYKRFFDARSHSSMPVAAQLNGKACWLAHAPTLSLIESATFQAVLRSGPSGMRRRYEFGKADQFYCVIGRGVGDAATIGLFSSEELARHAYDDAIKRHEQDRHWQRV
jgi:hypothetical protein